ncbi:MAG: uroporphyrinogen decarboxylase family protein [Fibrobacterota bacterium]
MTETWDKLPDGTPRFTQVIKTPEGILRAVQEFPKDKGSYHTEFFVKGPEDLKAFACFIRKTTEAVVSNPAVRQRVDENIKKAREEVHGIFPTEIHVFCGAVELMSSYYMGQETAIYQIHDARDLMEELMEHHWNMTRVWLELAAQNDIDIYNYAINGLEWLSPDIYNRYMIPQARRINEFAAAHGKLSWIHTCGKLKKLAQAKVYQQMKVKVVESLSSLPTGDISDLAQTRREIGPEITTRGGINVEYFYGSDKAALIRQAEHVLDATKGYRHMLGDTNSSYPAYPWENIQAVIDLVRKRGRLCA